METVMYCVTCIAAYLIGSVLSAILISKLNKGPDIRTVGSKNPGANNVLRTLGWKWALGAFLFDAGKAVLACWIGSKFLYPFGKSQYGAMIAAIFVTLGHDYPFFFRFKGGKGVSSLVGIMLYFYPIQGVLSILVFIVVLLFTEYVSLSSISMAAAFMIFLKISYPEDRIVFLWAGILFLFCLYRHVANIQRIINGTENKIHLI